MMPGIDAIVVVDAVVTVVVDEKENALIACCDTRSDESSLYDVT